MTEICIHSFRFAENVHLVTEAPRCLSGEELARAGRFKVERARNDFLVSHHLLRQTLCRYLRTDVRAISYRYGQHGKPHLDVPYRGELNFNLSHSGDRLLIAVCQDCQIGVDIERIQERSKPLQLARHFMSELEALQLAGLKDPLAQREFFFTLWTRKEAYVKSIGTGFFHALDKTVMVQLTPGVHAPSAEEYRDYRVIDLEIAADYKAAVAIRIDGENPAGKIITRVLEE